jgi:hypothetical protein
MVAVAGVPSSPGWRCWSPIAAVALVAGMLALVADPKLGGGGRRARSRGPQLAARARGSRWPPSSRSSARARCAPCSRWQRHQLGPAPWTAPTSSGAALALVGGDLGGGDHATRGARGTGPRSALHAEFAAAVATRRLASSSAGPAPDRGTAQLHGDRGAALSRREPACIARTSDSATRD